MKKHLSGSQKRKRRAVEESLKQRGYRFGQMDENVTDDTCDQCGRRFINKEFMGIKTVDMPDGFMWAHHCLTCVGIAA